MCANQPRVPSGSTTWQEKEAQTGHVCQAEVPHGRKRRHKPAMCAKRKHHMAGKGGTKKGTNRAPNTEI